MESIIAPLHLGNTGQKVVALQNALLQLIQNNLLAFEDESVIQALVTERTQMVFGSITAVAVRRYMLQNQIDAEAFPLVNADLAQSINAQLAQLESDGDITITGTVKNAADRGLPNVEVSLKNKDLRTDLIIASTTTDELGKFSFVLTQTDRIEIKNKSVDAFVSASIAGTEYKSSTLFNIQRDAVLDILCTNDVNNVAVSSEFAELMAKISAYVGQTIELSELEVEDAELIANEIEENQVAVEKFIIAQQVSGKFSIAGANIYAALRAGSYTSIEAMSLIEFEEAKHLLVDAQNRGIIDAINEANIEDEAMSLVSLHVKLIDRLDTSVFTQLCFGLTAAKAAKYKAYYAANRDKYNYLDELPNDFTANDKLKIKANHAYFVLTGANFGLHKILAVGDAATQPELNCARTIADWIVIIENARSRQNSDFRLPSIIQGDTIAEQNEHYATVLQTAFDGSYTLHNLVTQIENDNETAFPNLRNSLGSFQEANPKFNLLRTSHLALKSANNRFDFTVFEEGIDEQKNFIEEVACCQRLMKVTSSYRVMSKMISNGIRSSLDIYAMSVDAFVDEYADDFGGASAARYVYDIAGNNVMLSATGAQLAAELMVRGPLDQVIFGANNLSLTDAYPDLEELFGNMDYCACNHCRSVYSASAYFADMLDLLRKFNTDAYAKLKEKRADLWNLELSCKNANTQLPHVDLVNELLEDILDPPSTLIGPYNLNARNTTATDKQLKAMPEYLNQNVYSNLLTKAYPWNLPYNYYTSQVGKYIKLLNVDPKAIVLDFSTFTPSTAFDSAMILPPAVIDQVCNYLGLTSQMYNIIVDAAPALAMLKEYWGVHPSGNIADPVDHSPLAVSTPMAAASLSPLRTFNKVNVFLQQSRLSYQQMLELLDCYFINAENSALLGDRKIKVVSIDPAQPATCNTSLLALEGLNEIDLNKMHRFVRLANALNLNYYDLDKLLLTVQAIDNTVTDIVPSTMAYLAQLRYVQQRLQLDVDDVCTMYRPIEVRPYRNFEGEKPVALATQFESLFRNQTVYDISSATYPFPTSDRLSANFPIRTTAQAQLQDTNLEVVLACLGIKEQVFQSIIDAYAADPALSIGGNITSTVGGVARLDFNVTTPFPAMHTLAVVYRECLMASQSGLPIDQYLEVRKILKTSGLIFDSNPIATINFLDKLANILKAGISTKQLNWLFSDYNVGSVELKQQESDVIKHMIALKSALVNVSAYDAQADTDGKVIASILERAFNKSTATTLMTIANIEFAAAPLIIDLALHTNFITVLNGLPNCPLSPSTIEADLLGANPSLTATTATYAVPTQSIHVLDRYNYLHVLAVQQLQTVQIKEFVVKSFKMDAEIVDKYFTVYGVTTTSAYEACLDEDFLNAPTIDSNALTAGAPSPSALKLQAVFLILARVLKLATILEKFNLNQQDLAMLFARKGNVMPNNIADIFQLPINNFGTQAAVPATQWLYLLELLAVKHELDSSNTSFATLLSTSITSQADWLNAVKEAYALDAADLNTLTGSSIINFNFSNHQHVQASTYWKLLACLQQQAIIKLSCSTITELATKCTSAVNQADADFVIALAKANFNNREWLTKITPINDALRVERRDAMVACLVGIPPVNFEFKWFTEYDLFEQLLIDTQMMPCMLTTRTRFAIGTVQLFIERCLLQLEHKVGTTNMLTLTSETARQWRMWRKYYRIWEANRKVFLYPENWIEPELRDNKTPFFVELENFFKQNEPTPQNVEEAYKVYLQKLQDVAHLDPIAVYNENSEDFTAGNDTHTTHVWARSRTQPQLYYYRKRMLNEWTPWERMDLQIDGDHFVPVIWRGQLRFYWLIFTKQPVEKNLKVGIDEEAMPTIYNFKIELAFSEYKNGKWQPKQIGKSFLKTCNAGAFRSVDLQYWSNNWNSIGATYWGKNSIVDTVDTVNNTLRNIKKGTVLYAFKNGDGDLEIRVSAAFHAARATDYFASITNPAGANTESLNAFINKGNLAAVPQYFGAFIVKHSGIFVRAQSNNPIYDETHFYSFDGGMYHADLPSFYQSMVDEQSSIYSASPKHNHNTEHLYVGRRFQQKFWQFATSSGTDILLDKAPQYLPTKDRFLQYQRTVPFNTGNVMQAADSNTFFYRDYRNNFFVERLRGGIPSAGLGNPAAGTNIVITADSTIVTVFPSYSVLGSAYGTSGTMASNAQVLAAMPKSNDFLTYSDPIFLDGDDAVNAVVEQPEYRFHHFYHYKCEQIADILYKQGLDAMFDFEFQLINAQANFNTDIIKFAGEYEPTAKVENKYPHSLLDFSFEGAYSIYNWEIFFHIPMLIANKLSLDQKFEEARNWYHYVFNPTSNRSGDAERFWNFYPFYKLAVQSGGTLPSAINILVNAMSDVQAVNRWAHDPFKPHLVARTRMSAYMKNAAMKYIDNLISWADNLFTRDTMETVNEATQLYITAAQLLGRRPIKSPARSTPVTKTYAQLIVSNGGTNIFSNALVEVETLASSIGSSVGSAINSTVVMLYFCVPSNEKLLSYWDTIADRLFKIRHCMNLAGVERQLSVFDPPIDPALLVRAAANGLSLSDVVGAFGSPMPQYRFHYILQKATELAQEVKSLGASILSAIEKQDSERLSLIRSSQEIRMLELSAELREQQEEESRANLDAIREQKRNIEARLRHFSSLVESGLNASELLHNSSMLVSLGLRAQSLPTHLLASMLTMFPDIKLGSPTSIGATFGGSNLGKGLSLIGQAVDGLAGLNDLIGSMAAARGSNKRREQDWIFQRDSTAKEVKQIDKQILASEIRYQISKLEVRNQRKQMEHTLQMDELMRTKFSNQELYSWMLGELASTYFQTYRLAIDVAKQAERCYNFELGIAKPKSFIKEVYWNSMKKGLLAGEALLHDLKVMDNNFMGQHKRQHELVKNISLAQVVPQAVLNIREGNKTSITLPEWLFDMDYPGHYYRRIKSVSISIPCIAGPYSTVACKLTLNSSKYRKQSIVSGGNVYDDTHFETQYHGSQSIATSSAQNDSGMFEFSFKDERYLPFEGAGVASTWTIELPSKFASFDSLSITDIILHIKYTALYDGVLAKSVETNLADQLKTLATAGLPKLFNLSREFANEWHSFIEAYAASVQANTAKPKFSITLQQDMLPHYCKGKTVQLAKVSGSVYAGNAFYTLPLANAINIVASAAGNNVNIVQLDKEPEDCISPNPPEITAAQGLVLDFDFDPKSVQDLNAITDIFFCMIYTVS
jgi:hypothetical protein